MINQLVVPYTSELVAVHWALARSKYTVELLAVHWALAGSSILRWITSCTLDTGWDFNILLNDQPVQLNILLAMNKQLVVQYTAELVAGWEFNILLKYRLYIRTYLVIEYTASCE